MLQYCKITARWIFSPSYSSELFEINLQSKPFRPRIQGVLAKISKKGRMEVGAGTSMSPYDTGTTLVEICPRIEAYQNSYQLPLNQVQWFVRWVING